MKKFTVTLSFEDVEADTADEAAENISMFLRENTMFNDAFEVVEQKKKGKKK